jgi:hypothetical protein
MTYHEIFPIGATVFIAGQPPLTVGSHVDSLPGVELVKDGKHCLTVNPEWLVQLAIAVRFPEVAA